MVYIVLNIHGKGGSNNSIKITYRKHFLQQNTEMLYYLRHSHKF